MSPIDCYRKNKNTMVSSQLWYYCSSYSCILPGDGIKIMLIYWNYRNINFRVYKNYLCDTQCHRTFNLSKNLEYNCYYVFYKCVFITSPLIYVSFAIYIISLETFNDNHLYTFWIRLYTNNDLQLTSMSLKLVPIRICASCNIMGGSQT